MLTFFLRRGWSEQNDTATLSSYTFSRVFSSGNARARDPLEAKLREASQRGGRSHLSEVAVVCVLRRSIFIDFMRWLWITNYSENCFQGEHKPASYFDHQGTEVPGFWPSDVYDVWGKKGDKRRCVNCLEVNHAKSGLVWFGFLADNSPAESDFTELQDLACFSEMLFDIVWHWLGNYIYIYIFK